jgi:DNA polymerase-1
MVLFEKLKLPPGKKNTQGYSTSADILENLIDQHEIVPLVIEYRFISKLKSTFVDGPVAADKPENGQGAYNIQSSNNRNGQDFINRA